MHIFLATGLMPHCKRVIADMQYPNILTAFPYKTSMPTSYLPKKVIVDSGAFTAWNAGKSVDLAAYAEWALSQQALHSDFVAVNLDVIPGEVGRTSTASERIAGMKESLANADHLRRKGLRVMEVFHQDEPLTFLDELCDRLPIGDIIGISPRNDVSVVVKMQWQRVVLQHLVKRFGLTALPKMHGLAVTSRSMLENFPYYSTDSSTYMSPARFGSVMTEWGNHESASNVFGGRNIRAAQVGALQTLLRRSIDNHIMMERSATKLWASRGITWDR